MQSNQTKGGWEIKTRDVFSKHINLNPSQITIHRQTNYESNCSSTLSKFVTEPLTIQEFKTYDTEMTAQQREKIRVIRKYFKSINDQEFISLFEKRYIHFIPDGVDLKHLQRHHKHPIRYLQEKSSLCIDINYYLIKYDYVIAEKLLHLQDPYLRDETLNKQNQQKFLDLAF